MIKQRFETWLEEGKQKYGSFEQFKIQCPSCGHIQTPQDFATIGLSKESALFSCIGRHLPEKGCNWSAGGLLNTLGKGRVILKDLVPHEIFSFEDNSNVIEDRIETTCPGLGVKSWDNFVWEEWIPEEVRKQIIGFWSSFSGRCPDTWAKDVIERNGPSFGEVITLHEIGGSGKTATGRFVHCWNNIGRLIDDQGNVHYVSF